MEELQLGQYGVPVILTVLLGFVYKVINLGDEVGSNRIKVILSVVCGIALGLLALVYKCQLPDSKLIFNFVSIVDYILYGFMLGCSAIGIYELQKGVRGK